MTALVETCIGAGIRLQLVPSKCSFVGPPTAQMSLLPSAEIPPTPAPVKAGLVTMLQLVPLKCSTKAFEEPMAVPTAQAFFDETAVTPVRKPPLGRGGLEMMLQLVPFQCSMGLAGSTVSRVRMTIGRPHPLPGYPTESALYPVSVRRVRFLASASFRSRLTTGTLA
jgi:hypothetical protein